jgi:hypothetical protein
MLNLLCGYGQCGKSVGKGWKKCRKEYCEKGVENMWKTITWENCEKNIVEKYVEKNSMGKCEKQ